MNKKKVFFISLLLLSGCDNSSNNDNIKDSQPEQRSIQVQQQPLQKPKNNNSVDLNYLLEKNKSNNISSKENNNDTGIVSKSSNDYSDPIQTLNDLRSIYGLNRLYQNRELEFAAAKHAYYLTTQEQPSHFEEENQPNFFGKDPMARALRANYSNQSFSVGEVLAFYDGDRNNDIEKFLVAIYHRFLILEPKYNEIGSYYIKNNNTNIIEIMLGVRGLTNSNLQYSYYPYDNQINIPTLFYPAQEMPNPLPDRDVVGYPITFQITSGNNLKIGKFELLDDKNQKQDGKIMTSETDEHLTSSQFGFIPYNKLTPNTKYSINISGTINNNSFSKSWSFTTKQDESISISLNKKEFMPNENVVLKYSGVETRSVNMMSKVIGSQTALVKVSEQTWGTINLQTMSGCKLQQGCVVTLTLMDGDGKEKSVNIKVFP